VEYFAAKVSYLTMTKAIARTCPRGQEPVADVLASGLLLSNGAQVRLTRMSQEFGDDGAGRSI
jgi:hypothetical protein